MTFDFSMVEEKVAHWFRHEYSRLLSMLVARYGTQHIELVEDAIHEALYKAMQVWGYKGMPDNPSAWMYRVASNTIIDAFRKNKPETGIPDNYDLEETKAATDEEDERLRLIFACCHPDLKKHESIVLCLKFVAGFGLNEISRALFSTYEATKKNFQRSKNHFKQYNLTLEMPEEKAQKERLQRVLKVIFLIFTEGYRATEGDTALKEDLCFEAMRLAMLVYRSKELKNTEVAALLAAMCYKSARIDARMQKGGEFVAFAEQDRSLWAYDLIEQGNQFYREAIKKDNLSEYHFHAAIEAQYVNVKSYEETNWERLLNIYNFWKRMYENPSLELNRVVVFMKVHGAEEALKELEKHCSEAQGHLYFAIKAELMKTVGNNMEAISCLEKAISLTRNKMEKRLMEKKIKALS